MGGVVYFDTDAFHRIAQTFDSKELPTILRDRIILSPITALEFLSKLTLSQADEMLKQIHSMGNWLNPNRAGLLPWPATAIALYGFGMSQDEDFTEHLGHALNACLISDSADAMREPAVKLKDWLERAKDEAAGNFGRLLEAFREEPLPEDKLQELFVAGLAARVGLKPDARPVAQVIDSLGAYYEFEMEKLRVAAKNPNYNPEKHKNDLLDAEQLVYLGDPNLHFLTCDGGFARLIASSPQRNRIQVTAAEHLACSDEAIGLLCKITNS